MQHIIEFLGKDQAKDFSMGHMAFSISETKYVFRWRMKWEGWF